MSPSDGAGGVPGTVYLLHFDRPYRHARHYRGWTTDLDARLAEHAAGRGARLVAVITAAGIGFTLARTWPGTRQRERQLKRQGGASRNCPLCGITPQPEHRSPTTAATAPAAGDEQRRAWSALRSPTSTSRLPVAMPDPPANEPEERSPAMTFPWMHPSELDAARAEAAHDLRPIEAQRADEDYHRRAYQQWLAEQADTIEHDQQDTWAREYSPATHTVTEPDDVPRCATCSEPGSHAGCIQAELDAAERDPSRYGWSPQQLEALRQARDAAAAREQAERRGAENTAADQRAEREHDTAPEVTANDADAEPARAGAADADLNRWAPAGDVAPASREVNPIERVHRALDHLAQQQAAQVRQVDTAARGEQLARWHADDQAAQQQVAAREGPDHG